MLRCTLRVLGIAGRKIWRVNGTEGLQGNHLNLNSIISLRYKKKNLFKG